MSNAKLIPTGYNLLIEPKKVQDKSAGGILLGSTEREQSACEIGVVVAIGPIAFHGVTGCDPEKYPPGDARHKMRPHEIWGVNIGDTIMHKRYAGDSTYIKDFKDFRLVPDTEIIGVVQGDIELTKAVDF